MSSLHLKRHLATGAPASTPDWHAVQDAVQGAVQTVEGAEDVGVGSVTETARGCRFDFFVGSGFPVSELLRLLQPTLGSVRVEAKCEDAQAYHPLRLTVSVYSDNIPGAASKRRHRVALVTALLCVSAMALAGAILGRTHWLIA